jgi:hypothetical protein
MDQKGEAGRDLIQVGRDVKKFVELSLSNQHSTQVSIYSRDNSLLNVYQSRWEKYGEEERIGIVTSWIKDIHKIPRYYFHLYDRELIILVALLVLLIMSTHNSDATAWMSKGEYSLYRSFCIVTNSRENPKTNEVRSIMLCPEYEKLDNFPQSELTSEVHLQSSFKEYKTSWIRFTLFWVLTPLLISSLLGKLINLPLQIIAFFLNSRYEQTRQAKIQEARFLFSLLSSYEKEIVKSKIPSYELEEII